MELKWEKSFALSARSRLTWTMYLRAGLLLLTCTALWTTSPGSCAGSCRKAAMCCRGRDSSCVVQKAPINSVIEDLSDQPCYCDHACMKVGDCCHDFKQHCGGMSFFFSCGDYLCMYNNAVLRLSKLFYVSMLIYGKLVTTFSILTFWVCFLFHLHIQM